MAVVEGFFVSEGSGEQLESGTERVGYQRDGGSEQDLVKNAS